jgi:ABC-2 type transport system ATP-binding protein
MYWRGDFDSLKDSIVRIHVRSQTAFPEGWSIPNALSTEIQGGYATAIVGDWTAATQSELERRLDAPLEVESLTLEDIFLELHR